MRSQTMGNEPRRYGWPSLAVFALVASVLSGALMGPAPAAAAAPPPAGTITTYGKTPMTAVLHVATGPDGNLWYTATVPNTVGRMTPAGVATNFTATGVD